MAQDPPPLFNSSDPTLLAPAPVSDLWADMMPSMGVTTPLQELPDSSGEQPLSDAAESSLM